MWYDRNNIFIMIHNHQWSKEQTDSIIYTLHIELTAAKILKNVMRLELISLFLQISFTHLYYVCQSNGPASLSLAGLTL